MKMQIYTLYLALRDRDHHALAKELKYLPYSDSPSNLTAVVRSQMAHDILDYLTDCELRGHGIWVGIFTPSVIKSDDSVMWRQLTSFFSYSDENGVGDDTYIGSDEENTDYPVLFMRPATPFLAVERKRIIYEDGRF